VVNIPARLPRPKIRIGYLAGELREHATSILMTGVFECHDRERFEVYAFDNGWDDGGELRRRQNAAFHKIINISKVGDLEAARIIAENEIDILIDLNGFFGAGRQEVFAFKVSPVQVSYLGCPGTMGTDYFDYLIADGVVIPEGSDSYYDEKIVRLPHTYQANDFKRKVSERVFTRAEMGLPEQGFVFCCFNNNYKITPETFSQWMRILQKVEGSVLWLFETSQASVLNLRREAEKRGVHPDRLIFAQPLPSPEHLARHRLADLFLDTLPYNAHTTASDALWMGLPLVTQVGTTFPGRVAASLLTALGVPELITQTPEAYEALAIELALAPAKLKAVREKIISQRATAPLFNTKLFTRHFEQALQAMYERHQSGLPPAAITIQK
jgi:predicted O-linked N-acetylglucosamine transferase (SPINDLY family)